MISVSCPSYKFDVCLNMFVIKRIGLVIDSNNIYIIIDK